jgi:transposase
MATKTTTRRSFTDEFKREAVSLLASSGRPLTQVATELDIQPSMLRSWRGTVNGIPKPGWMPRPPMPLRCPQPQAPETAGDLMGAAMRISCSHRPVEFGEDANSELHSRDGRTAPAKKERGANQEPD